MKKLKKQYIYFIGSLFSVPLIIFLVFLSNGSILPHLSFKGNGQNIELIPYIFCSLVGIYLAIIGFKSSKLKKSFITLILFNIFWLILSLIFTIDMWGEL